MIDFIGNFCYYKTMTKQMIKDINALAKRYGYDVMFECLYCNHSTETLFEDCEPSEMVTFTQKGANDSETGNN